MREQAAEPEHGADDSSSEEETSEEEEEAAAAAAPSYSYRNQRQQYR
jgi:hypothetical protein